MTMVYGDELYHFGKKGMKWGVRRYQNKDGTLTDAGKKRYSRDSREQGFDKYDSDKGTYYRTSKKNGRSDNIADPNKYVRQDLERTKNVADAGANMSRTLKNITDKSIRNNKRKMMDLSDMTDKEMRDQINRAMLERQYNDMFAPRKSTRGREYVSKILDNAGDVLAVTASALSIALAIQKLNGGGTIGKFTSR